jgi:hypothetical protein
MDLLAFEHDRGFVVKALRRGEIDYLEPVTEAVEADLFRHLIDRQVLDRLAESYPTPRKKQEVPVWLYLASELSLKLHGAQSYHAYPRLLRSGGLIDALGPKLGGRKTRHPETGEVTLACPGFNRKNDYDRQTPCDQDFLRKFARDTDVERLHAWFNRALPRALRSLKLFDEEGLFVGDASYLFVPDNEHYEGSDRLWFDEHNHPVDSDQVDVRDRRYQLRRCYKLVSLIHLNRRLEFFFVVAARVVSGRLHECPLLYELAERFVEAVGPGVMKMLIVDRGLIDGPRMGRLKQVCHVDTLLPLRRNMDAYADAIGLTRLPGFQWEPYRRPEPAPPSSPPPPKPPRVAQREAKRQQKLAQRKAEAEASQPNPATAKPTVKLGLPHTLLGIGRGLLSWRDCPVPLTAVINREVDEQGQSQDWVLVTTSAKLNAQQVRSTYELRTAIEERHRQYKCFWDLTRLHSCAFSLVANQALFVLLTYTLLQAHLLLRQRQRLNGLTRTSVLDLLAPTLEVVAVYFQQRFCLLSLPEFARILLTLEEAARKKLLKKFRRFENNLDGLLNNPRPP